MTTRSNGDENGEIGEEMENDETIVAEYEKSRQQRIKQNLQKMHKLGILELSRNFKPPTKPKIKSIRPQKPSPSSLRRSFRLKRIPPVDYPNIFIPKAKPMMNVKPEIYTENHEKMLGDQIETWKLLVDGDDGEMSNTCYAVKGKRCHQCRMKVARTRSICSKCKTVRRLYCGSCLLNRYGENVLEASANPNWVCPVCRDICNCSYCRRAKGWEPVGNFYLKALRLGFKSVAHYLIHTHGPRGKYDHNENEDVHKLEI